MRHHQALVLRFYITHKGRYPAGDFFSIGLQSSR